MDTSVFKKRSSGKFAKFATPGATVAGTITEISDQKQATKWNPDPKAPRELDFWPSGDPVMEVWITVQTQDRDPQDPEDTGQRTIVVTVNQKAGGPLAAIIDACEQAGVESPLPGGFLALTFTQFDPESKNPQNPRKLYAAKYQAPAPGGGAFQAQAQQAPAVQQPAAQQYNEWNPAPPAQQQAAPPSWAQAPAQQQAQAYQPPVQVNTTTGEIAAQQAPAPAAAPQQGGVDAVQIQALIAQGMDDATIQQTTGAPAAAVAAIRAIS
ncbi:hypothetical protein [Arthrobacter sp. C152]